MAYDKGEWLTYADYSGEISAVVVKGKGKALMGICSMNQDSKNVEANANRIVLAVNCHDDLYEALKSANEFIALISGQLTRGTLMMMKNWK